MDTTDTSLADPTARIRRWSRLLRGIATALVVMVPVGVAWTWSHFDELAAILPSTAGIPYDPAYVTPLIRLGAFGVNMVPGLIAMFGFWQLRHLFGLFAAGRYFETDVIQRVRTFALTAVAYGIAAPLSRLGIGLLISLGNPPGERILMLRISSDDLVIVFLGGVFFVIAKVWSIVKTMADENAQIV